MLKPKLNRISALVGVVAATVLALTLVGSVAAHTSPASTKHDTTFDNVAPRRLESDLPPPGPPPFDQGYVPGSVSPCNGFFGIPGVSFPQWTYVGPQPQTLEGEVVNAPFVMTDDSPFDHFSRDRNVYIHPYPQSAYLLAAPGNFQTGEQDERGRIEMEWESAALPAWAHPTWGDQVHIEGGHIWDCAHSDVSDGYRTEIHPPLVVESLRDAAKGWPDDANPALPARPGWVDAMPGLGSVPVPVTRADVFGSSDGGEALEQENCFYHSCSVPDWYQPLAIKNYDFFIPAPPKPDQDAQLVTKLINHPFPNCASDSDNHDDCGSLDVLNDTNRITFTNTPTGVAVHVSFDGFTEPQNLLYGFGFTLEVGWNRPATTIPQRVKVTVEKVHIKTTMDDLGNGPAAEWEIAAMIGDNFKHLLLTETNGDGVGYEWNQGVPTTNDVDVGDYGIKGSGPECALQTDSATDPGPCKKVFEVTLLPGEPLRISFRAEEDDLGANFNNAAGAVERIITDTTPDNGINDYAIGEKTEWFQERSSAGDIDLDGDCDPDPCGNITYKVEDDPIPAPPATAITAGAPVVMQGGATWVTSASNLTLQGTAPSGHESDALEIHEHFWRSGTAVPGDSVCNAPGSTTSCTLHLNANDAQDGHYTVEFWSVDQTTGAIEPPHSATFELDNTPPTTASSLAGTLVRGWYNTPVTVTLSAGDNPGVGVDHTDYIVDPPGLSLPYSSPFVVSGDSSSHTVQFSSVDKLANVESAKSTSFKIDTTAPTLSISSASDGAFSYTQNELLGGIFTNAASLSVSYSASDALSGVYQVRLDGSPIASSPITLALPAGISTHSLVAEDVAGNLTTFTFSVVSVMPLPGGPDPQGAGFWKNYGGADLGTLLAEVDVASRAFGTPDNRYADATLANYQDYLAPGPNPTADQKVRRELLAAWLNLVSGREPAAQTVDLKSVSDWPTVVTNTGGSSITTALNLVRESERRLEEPNPALDTIKTLLEKLNTGKLK